MELTGKTNDEAMGKNEREKKKEEKDIEEEEMKEKKSVSKNKGMRGLPWDHSPISDWIFKWHCWVGQFFPLETRASSMH